MSFLHKVIAALTTLLRHDTYRLGTVTSKSPTTNDNTYG